MLKNCGITVLGDAGLSGGDYVEQSTFLLLLKMIHDQTPAEALFSVMVLV